MGERFVLVPAPVLGPASWAPVARELAGAGHEVTVASLSGFTDQGPPYLPRLVDRVCAQLPPGLADRVVLVTHSGAGVFAPYLAAAVRARTVAVIFADAALPPVSGSAHVIDSAFLPFLQDLARGGLVPPWPRWWPAEDLAPLFPDRETERVVTAEAPSLPLAFFEEELPPLPGSWHSCRSAFLCFSEGYQELAAEAASRGWPVRGLPGEHLHMLVRPAQVAGAISDLAAGLGRETGPGG